MINKEAYKIISNHFIKKLDFNEVYNLSAEQSKKMFSKKDIVDSIKRMILSYPHFDNSVKNRIESSTLLLGVRYGIINNYIYILPSQTIFPRNVTHLMKEERLFEVANKINDYHLIMNIKDILRTIKIKKICKTI
jgi:hypothetical protein